MFWFILLAALLVGVLCVFVTIGDSALAFVLAIVVLVVCVIGFFLFLSNPVGLFKLVAGSWVSITGVHSPSEIIVMSHSCPQQNVWLSAFKMAAAIFLSAVGLLAAALGIATIVLIPFGMVVAVIGAVKALVNKAEDIETLRRGLRWLFFGLVAILISAFLMLLVHLATLWIAHC